MVDAVNPYGAPKSAIDEAPATQPVKVFSVSGRIGRIRYIAWGMGLMVLIGIVGGLLAAVAGAVAGPAAGAVLVLMWVAIIATGVMLTIQRCHDFNVSGWLALLYFVPLANLVFWFIPGTDGPNRFGNPTPPNSTLAIVLVCFAALGIPVIGILAAVAIPAYQDYTHRARVTEAIVATMPWRTAISEHHARTGKLPSSAAELSKDAALPDGGRYGKVSLGADGMMTVTLSAETGRLAGKTLLVQPQQAGGAITSWDCTGGTLEAKYRPGSCRRR